MTANDLQFLEVTSKIEALETLYADLRDLLRNDAHDGGREKAKMARNWIRSRRTRDHYFPSGLFTDPAWDMLLDLYAAQHEGQRVSVSSLCIAASVPATTALRHIASMVDDGYFAREVDNADGRRVHVKLTAKAQVALDSYFREVARIS